MLCCLAALACGEGLRGAPLPGAGNRGGAPDSSWRLDPVWDDGKAEFCVYALDWQRYGGVYPGRVLLVLVKEPWAPDLQVKADRPRADGFDVLKLNYVRDVPTGIYTYHQMASVFFRRDSGALVKVAATSSEACGVSTALLVGGELQTHSYFDGEGAQRVDFPRHAVPADGLPALLRDYVLGEPPERIDVFPLLLMGRFPSLKPQTFSVSKRAHGALEVPAGTFDAVELRLSADAGSESYFFERQPPCRLLLFRGADGTEYRLVKGERLPYWRMHQQGDEAWLPASLREGPGRDEGGEP